MPELPEVETVRLGLRRRVAGQTVRSVHVHHPRAVRRQSEGADGFVAHLTGRRLGSPERRGKFLWFPLDGSDLLLVAHLGMSGQFRYHLTGPPGGCRRPTDPHARLDLVLRTGGVLRFRDQRTFGWMLACPAVDGIPSVVRHIAPDPLDPGFDAARVISRIRRSSSGVKRMLLDQSIVSGIGNIYADEALWEARVRYDTPGSVLTDRQSSALLEAAAVVLARAVAAGGTDFDGLYVGVEGESGWFGQSLRAYGRQGLPCSRCGVLIRKDRYAGRSCHWCPECVRTG